MLELLKLKLPGTGRHDYQFKIITALPSQHFILGGEYLYTITVADRSVSLCSHLGKHGPRRFSSRMRNSNNPPQL